MDYHALQMSRTQKNKATEYHLGQLKAKLAKLRTQLQEPAKVCLCVPLRHLTSFIAARF